MFDGSKNYTIIPNEKQVTISPYNENDETMIMPSKLLTFYEKGYKAKMDIVQNVKGRKIQYIKC